MGSKYTSQSASGYNASPPSDDGTASEANKVKWSTIKTKLADVVKTLAESINSALVTALDKSARSVTASDTAAASDNERTIEVRTSSVSITLSDAATMGAGYIVSVANQSSGDISVVLATATNTIDGVTNTTATISALETRQYIVNAAATGYITKSRSSYAPTPFGPLIGGYVDWSTSANALTLSVKTWAGNDPSATEPVFVAVRSATAGSAAPSLVKLTAALTLTVPDTGTLGTVNSQPFKLWSVIFNDGGTLRLGVINCATISANAGDGYNVTGIYPLSAWGIASSTAVGTGSDSAGVFYTGSGVTSKGYSVVGYATWESGLGTAGTWSSDPTREQLYGPGVPLPGTAVQPTVAVFTGAVATGTTLIPLDDSIPQNTEGDQYMSAAITPTSAAHAIQISSQAHITSNASSCANGIAIFVDSVANALAATFNIISAADFDTTVGVSLDRLAGSTSAQTFKIRCGGHTPGTLTFNGRSSSRIYGGVMNSYLKVSEVAT